MQPMATTRPLTLVKSFCAVWLLLAVFVTGCSPGKLGTREDLDQAADKMRSLESRLATDPSACIDYLELCERAMTLCLMLDGEEAQSVCANITDRCNTNLTKYCGDVVQEDAGPAPDPDTSPDAAPAPACGDDACEAGENCQSCPADCTCTEKTLTFAAVADSYVDEDRPSSNYGAGSRLYTDTGGDQHAYLRFAVSGLSGAVQGVKLRLYVANGSSSGPKVHATSSSWGETTITWNNRSAPGAALASMGSVPTGWFEVDLGAAAVTADGNHSFALVPTSSNGTDFYSRESSNAPSLVVTYLSGSAPPPPPPPPPVADAGVPPDSSPPPPEPDAAPEPDPAPPPSSGSIANQYAGITTWCRVQVHNHVDRFDSPQQCVADYKSAGFDLIFFTAHDDDPQLDPIPGSDPVTARGVEISSPRHGCALGINAAHKDTSYSSIQAAIDAVAAEGGIYQINHPNRDDLSPSVVTPLQNLWGIEVGNKGTRWASAEALWDSQISQGRPIWGTFSDDAHGSGVGRGWIDVGTASDCSQAAVLAAMKKGAFMMSNGPTLTLSVSGNTITAQSSGNTIDWYRENMTKIKTTAASGDTYTIAGNEVFVRVVATDSSGDVALSQPLFTQ